VYKLQGESGYDTSDRDAALKRSQEWGDRIAVGVFYEDTAAIYEDQIPALKQGPLVTRQHDPARVARLFAEFT
jgi:2-oxoglutarate ferredoxin oxidoreductase subunit beta